MHKSKTRGMKMERDQESLLIQRHKTIGWINKEINICIAQLKTQTHYRKVRTEGYIDALKKVQAKLDSHN